MHAALALVLAAAFVLRFAHLSSGIPYAVGIDEPAIMTTVVRILKSGSFNPHFFEYPTGYIYVQLGVAIVNFLFGAMQHTWKAVEQVGPSDFYLWGRAATAAIGTATVALLHRAGLRWGAAAGAARRRPAGRHAHARARVALRADGRAHDVRGRAHVPAVAARVREAGARRVRPGRRRRGPGRRASSTTASWRSRCPSWPRWPSRPGWRAPGRGGARRRRPRASPRSSSRRRTRCSICPRS